MILSSFVVVPDANVLFPFFLRDTVLRASAAGFFQIRWTSEILEEMERNLVSTGRAPPEKASRLRVIGLLRDQAADLRKPPMDLDALLVSLQLTTPGLVAAVRERLGEMRAMKAGK